MDDHVRLLVFIASDIHRPAQTRLAFQVGRRRLQTARIGRARVDERRTGGGAVVAVGVVGKGGVRDGEGFVAKSGRVVDGQLDDGALRRRFRSGPHVAVAEDDAVLDYRIRTCVAVEAVAAIVHDRAVVGAAVVETDAAASVVADKAVLDDARRTPAADAAACRGPRTAVSAKNFAAGNLDPAIHENVSAAVVPCGTLRRAAGDDAVGQCSARHEDIAARFERCAVADDAGDNRPGVLDMDVAALGVRRRRVGVLAADDSAIRDDRT